MTSVLIVEDEAIVAADLSNKLRKLGYSISGVTASGEEAVILAGDRQPQAVLMDIRLAGAMDGIDAADQIRRTCDLPVIFLTAHSDQPTLQRAKLTEPFGYILKPFEERELSTHLEMAIYKHQAEKKLRASEARLQQFNAELEKRVWERTAQVRSLAAELSQVEERERQRIAQILHDDLQQLLVAARMQLLDKAVGTDKKSRQGMSENISQILDQCIAISRELSHDLSPPILRDAGLIEALQWLGSWMFQKHGLKIQIKDSTCGQAVPDDLKLLIFHSVRELLFNVVKHAGVKHAEIQLNETADGQLLVLVSDNGNGFSAPSQMESYIPAGGLGLCRIRERIEWVGGQIRIESHPGHGSRVHLAAPLSCPAKGKAICAPTNA
jgi:signal transduction histidine kinase